MVIKISRHYLEDLSNYFLPIMLKMTEARARVNEGTELEDLYKISYSVLNDIDLMFDRKNLTLQKKFTIRLKDAEGIILYKMLLNFPIAGDDVWRVLLRNQIVEQLDKQIA
jgi:hypothetical protein